MDKVTKQKRSEVMRRVKSKNTRIEVTLRKALWHKSVRYRKNLKILNCHPDIVIKKYKIAIFCDGDFWHGKNERSYRVYTNTQYWNEKIRRNVERDLENTIELRDNGWTVLRFWESDIQKNLSRCVDIVLEAIAIKQGKV